MTDKRRTFNGTIPEHDNIRQLVARLDAQEEELRSLRRINRALIEVIEKQAIKVTIRETVD